MTERNFISYLRIYLALTGIYLVVIAFVNWAIDPYNELGRNTIGLYFATERQAKNSIVDFPHDAIVIGSSKIGMIDPDALHCYKFYNASFDGALPEEIYAYLKRYVKDEKMVVIGTDFEVFNEREWVVHDNEKWLEHSFGALEYLTSFRVFQNSLYALQKKHLKQELPIIADNGARREEPLSSSSSLPDLPEGVYDYAEGLKLLREHHFRRFLFSEKRMAYMRKMRDLLESRKTPYLIFINPLNEEVLKLIDETGNAKLFEEWRQEIRRIFPHVQDFSSGKFSAKEYYKHARDPYHYKPEVGAQIINSMLTCTQSLQ